MAERASLSVTSIVVQEKLKDPQKQRPTNFSSSKDVQRNLVKSTSLCGVGCGLDQFDGEFFNA